MRLTGIFEWIGLHELTEELGLDVKKPFLTPAVSLGENNFFSSNSNAILEADLEKKWYHRKTSAS